MTRSSLPRRFALAALLLSTSSAVALGIGEVAARFSESRRAKAPYRTTVGDSIHVSDTLRGWRTNAGAAFRVRSPEYRTDVRLNALGTRGAMAFDDASCRVLVIGDSFVAGYAVPDSSLFWWSIKPGCAVIGAGVEGYATDQELLMTEELLSQLRPTVVVLAFYQNDIWCNAVSVCEDTGKPLYELSGDSLRLTNVPVAPGRQAMKAASDTPPSLRGLTPKPPVAVTPPARGSIVLETKRWMQRNSALFRTARRALGRGEPPRAVASMSVRPLADEFRVLHEPNDDDVRAAWTITGALLARFNAIVSHAGAQPVILHIPLRESVYRDEWRAVADAQGFTDAWQPDTEERALRARCLASKWTCVFPADSLRANITGPRLYYYADPHWTPAGHAIVRRALAAAIPESRR